MKQRSITSWILACLLFGVASAHAAYEIYFQSGTIAPTEFEYRLAKTEAHTPRRSTIF